MISIKNISKIFYGGDAQVQVLRGVSFDINDGELVAVIGKSGSGKSTLLNIMDLLDNPTNGEYYINGKKVSSLSASDKAKARIPYGILYAKEPPEDVIRLIELVTINIKNGK